MNCIEAVKRKRFSLQDGIDLRVFPLGRAVNDLVQRTVSQINDCLQPGWLTNEALLSNLSYSSPAQVSELLSPLWTEHPFFSKRGSVNDFLTTMLLVTLVFMRRTLHSANHFERKQLIIWRIRLCYPFLFVQTEQHLFAYVRQEVFKSCFTSLTLGLTIQNLVSKCSRGKRTL